MMSKMKKIIISAIIGLLSLIGFYTTSNAYYVGQNLTLTYSDYINSSNIYCVEHHQALRGTMGYKVISHVDIKGNKSTDHKGKTIESPYNARLAYILSGNNGSRKNGPVANGIWNFMYTWIQNVGRHHAGLYSGYASSVKGSSTWMDSASAKYANEYGDLKIEDKTDKDKIRVNSYEKDGKQYLRVGPFKWKFNGTITKLEVKDQDGKNIKGVLYSSFNGNSQYWYDADGIKSGKNFYVSVPMDSGATKITKIVGHAKLEVKGVGIWFLEAKNGYMQNLIIRNPYTTTDKVETPFDYNVNLYVNLSGYVWLDRESGKQSVRNDLFKDNDYDTGDILLSKIKVRLMDRTTKKPVMEAETNDKGAYKFKNVIIDKLKDYYIEFEYDGLTYTNVIKHIDKDNGSKSAEGETVRDRFNKDFSVVEGESRSTGFTRNETGAKKYDLSYNVNENGHESTLINNGQYIITANTDVAGYVIKDHYKYGQKEIKYINLGLYERETPDISLIKDIENVRVAINGYEHTYKYAQRFINQGEYGDGFNVGVKFGEKYGSMSYSRAIYKSDYDYINEVDKDKELKVFITYRIGLRNESSNLTAQVNSIVDYYDSRYTIEGVGTDLDEKGNVSGNISHTDSTYDSKYAKTIINNNTRIEAKKEASIYVQFRLNREAVKNILDSKGENLFNVAEINTYSIFSKDGKVYAGIDADSNPGNAIPGDVRTYEDDTDSAPGLQLELADAREMSGKVFLDSTSGELLTGKVRQGDGEYKDGEKGISGVKVVLKENVENGKVYETITDENGDFYISGYIPGDYTLTYTWGDETYTVQNYKGTVYEKSRYDANVSNKEWYKTDVSRRWTDAVDDYKYRLDIDKEMLNIKNGTTTTIDKMNSTTPLMGIGVEYESLYTASTGDRYVFKIDNVDFGIVERARQDLALSKRVKTMKVTLANGQVVTDLTIEKDDKTGKLTMTGEKNNIAYMAPSPSAIPANGFIKLELDNELIQGTTVEVGYEFEAINNSELDYLSENFYKYGIIEGDVVTIQPSGIIDYLDRNWAFDNEKNPQWTVKTAEQIKEENIVAEVVYNNESLTGNQKLILYTDSLKEQKLKPKDSATVMLNVSKVLATSDEISLDNETEIVEVDKTGGSKLISTPGNYVPATGHTESDDGIAETVIVTPSTGENQNYVMIIALGVTLLVILGTGVVLIKKKALR